MDDSFNELTQFPVWPLPETAVGLLLCNCSLGALRHSHYVITIVPLVRGVKVVHSA